MKIEQYISELQMNVGNAQKISELLDNQELFLEYLRIIGVNNNWLERVAVVEIAKEKIKDILISKQAEISNTGIKYGQKELVVKDETFYLSYTGTEAEYIRFTPANNDEKQTTTDVEYVENKDKQHKRRMIIDKNGVAQLEEIYKPRSFLAFGVELTDTYSRLENKGSIEHTKNNVIDGKPFENKREIEEFGNPLTVEPVPDPRVFEFLKKYPLFRAWFEQRGYDTEHIISSIEEKQEEEFSNIHYEMNQKESKQKANLVKENMTTYLSLERKIAQFYEYIRELSPHKREMFIKALENVVKTKRRYAVGSEKVLARQTKRIESKEAFSDEFASLVQDIETKLYTTIGEVDEKATSILSARSKNATQDSLSEDNPKIAFLTERKHLLDEMKKTLARIEECFEEMCYQKGEVQDIKSSLTKMPLLRMKSEKMFKEER